MFKRLYRSRRDRVLSGVCGGIAEYLSVDPVLVRILWIAISCAFGAGIFIYIIGAIIIPEGEEQVPNSFDAADNYSDFGNEFNSDSGSEFNNETPGQGYDFDGESFETQREEWNEPPKYDAGKSRMLFGFILVCVGVIFFVREFFGWLDFKFLWPIIAIVAGVLFLTKGGRKTF